MKAKRFFSVSFDSRNDPAIRYLRLACGGGNTGGYSAPAAVPMAAPVVDAPYSVYDEDLPF